MTIWRPGKRIFVILDAVSFYKDLIICSLNNMMNIYDSVTTVVCVYLKYNSLIEYINSWCSTTYLHDTTFPTCALRTIQADSLVTYA